MKAKVKGFRIRGHGRLGEEGIILHGIDMRGVFNMIDPMDLARVSASFTTLEHNILDIDTSLTYPSYTDLDIDNYGFTQP